MRGILRSKEVYILCLGPASADESSIVFRLFSVKVFFVSNFSFASFIPESLSTHRTNSMAPSKRTRASDHATAAPSSRVVKRKTVTQSHRRQDGRSKAARVSVSPDGVAGFPTPELAEEDTPPPAGGRSHLGAMEHHGDHRLVVKNMTLEEVNDFEDSMGIPRTR